MTDTLDLAINPNITVSCRLCRYQLWYDADRAIYCHYPPPNWIDNWISQQCPASGREYRVVIPGMTIEPVIPTDTSQLSIDFSCDNKTEDPTNG